MRMILDSPISAVLVSADRAKALDAEASSQWGLNPFALVEAAGRACASVFVRAFPRFFCGFTPSIAVLAGSGNNAADALVMLRCLVLGEKARPGGASVLCTRIPGAPEQSPFSQALLAVQKLNIPALPWESPNAAAILAAADIVIDGVSGTGLQGPLRGSALAMVQAVNKLRAGSQPPRPFMVSIDVPSGIHDLWTPGMPAAGADATLAIEPQKQSMYTPAARTCAGTILPVGGIFPPALVEKYRDLELITWESAAACIAPVPVDAHKYGRGLAEIWAGSPGSVGAAKLAALGAQAAGAGLVRLIVDPPLYPLAAAAAFGVMVVPGGTDAEQGRFSPNAVLLGPGWGRGQDRLRLLETYLPREAQGLPLILDADAIALAKDMVFHGGVILTPHPGEFAAYTGLSKEEILANPIPALRRFSSQKNIHILLKGHVLYIAAPGGRVGLIDGMNPALAAGGTGDLLAGFCAAIAARQQAGQGFEGFSCAAAAAALLVRAGQSKRIAGRFIDPAELAAEAALIAGKEWLPETAHTARADRRGKRGNYF